MDWKTGLRAIFSKHYAPFENWGAYTEMEKYIEGFMPKVEQPKPVQPVTAPVKEEAKVEPKA